MSIVITKGATPTDWLKYEVEGAAYSREAVLLDSTQASAGLMTSGTLIGKVTATGAHKVWNPAATDGSEDIVGIVYLDVPRGDSRNVFRGTAIVRQAVVVAELVQDITGNGTVAQVKAGLAALGIVTRQAA